MPKAEPTADSVETTPYIIEEDIPATPVEDDDLETDLMFADHRTYSTSYFLAALIVLALFGGFFYWLGGARWIKRMILKSSNVKGGYRKVNSAGDDLEK